MRHLLALVLAACAMLSDVCALDDDEYNGYAADTLTIKVGYFGGPYYVKRVYTLEELRNMDLVYADYTFLDSMPSVVIDHVEGVRLSELVEEAGIDLGSVETFYFWTRDKTSDYYTAYSKSSLIDVPRYCYYGLPEQFDPEEEPEAGEMQLEEVPVETVLALADDWNRALAGAEFGSDYMNLNSNTRFRLIFGQETPFEQTADRRAKWIHEIVVELGGAPVLTFDEAVLEGKVGSILRTQPTIQADSAVLENGLIQWSSSDESIASVDENGSITIHGEGSAVITASFAGGTASVTVTGTQGEVSGPGPGERPPTDLPSEEGQDKTDTGKTPDQDPVPVEETVPQEKPAPQEQPAEQTRAEVYYELLEPEVKTETEQGGVQNWRKEEMDEQATELGNIRKDDRLTVPVLFGLLGIALLSCCGYCIIIKVQIRGDSKK